MALPYPINGTRCGLRTWHLWWVAKAGLVLLLVLAGCARVGPDYVVPEISVPDQWHSLSTDATGNSVQALKKWWQCLQDPMLTRLTHNAATGNLDVKKALSRVRQARARWVKSAALRFPTLDATGSVRKTSNANER